MTGGGPGGLILLRSKGSPQLRYKNIDFTGPGGAEPGYPPPSEYESRVTSKQKVAVKNYITNYYEYFYLPLSIPPAGLGVLGYL